ncbi:MAG: sulfatase [Verrucomicrobiales bacterium]
MPIPMSRFPFPHLRFASAAVLCAAALASFAAAGATEKPNFVVVFCDDLGYGDLSSFGHPTIETPHLDRMAAEGQKWTSFYAAASVCTPSRAGLLTGRLPIRSGMCSNVKRVLFPYSAGGLPSDEITIAAALRELGYRTAASGKWHLGHLPEFLPTSHGFESYFGIPYSNDMNRTERDVSQLELAEQENYEAYDVPLMRDEEIVERPADQRTITKRYTEEAVKKIREFKDEPFFVYLAHSLPHIPLFRAPEFKGHSTAGIYGDVIEEIDWSVGEVMKTLEEEGLAENTLVVFTSDNGPWLKFKTHGGSSGLLRDGKGSTWDGGMRVPTAMWWPGKLERGIVKEMGSTLDLLPTFVSLAGGTPPDDRVLDGHDLSPVLFGEGPSPRQDMFFYHAANLYAVRKGAFKAHYTTQTSYVQEPAKKHDPPLLYHVEHDPSEKHDVAGENPEVLAEIQKLADAHRDSVEPAEDQLAKRLPGTE